ncbi:hypothetical protein D5086_012753 [Populus alba]|uniref:Uncharacterized protein n=1 Tax=Populus alba TaxID=43335 RepID=A0ACC4C3B4_POPAL
MEVESQTLSHFSYSLDGNDISHDLRTHESPGFEMLSEEAQVTNSCDTEAPVGGACLDSAAAVKLQKVYRGYRTRRRLADSAVVAEELWQVGKGLAMDVKAQKLAFQHWIEAIDPRHRYGHVLHLYYEEWCKADSGQPFFYWLDVGDGKELDLKQCPKSKLREQCIKYLGPQEREHYEYIISEGKIIHKQTGDLLDTTPGAKWIFVMSTSKRLYAGEKRKGTFHHSSFLAGGATVSAGRLMAEHGILKSISPYSGHYRPSEESFKSFLSFLNDNGVNLDEVQWPGYSWHKFNYLLLQINKASEDSDTYDDGKYNGSGRMIDLIRSLEPPKLKIKEDPISELPEVEQAEKKGEYKRTLSGGLQSPRAEVPKTAILQRINSKKAAKSYQLGHQISLKWSTGAGPRIGCVADYPLEVRVQALEFVNLSPRTPRAPTCWRTSGLASPAAQPTQDLPGGDGTSH